MSFDYGFATEDAKDKESWKDREGRGDDDEENGDNIVDGSSPRGVRSLSGSVG